MSAAEQLDGGEVLGRLAWDSDYFGFPVARITGAELDDAKLLDALGNARTQSIRLVYWGTSPSRLVSPEILAEFQGKLVDEKATFARELGSVPGEMPTSQAAFFDVVELPQGPACPRLMALGMSAGHHSRFRTDSRISDAQYRGLYGMWMQRSTLRELADAVFIAINQGNPVEPIGVVTVSESEGVGRIGLIAVHDSVRGQGAGKRLMEAAHAWMRSAGAKHVEVVTQLANRGACRLYRSCGYQLRDVVNYYHFWPLVMDSAD